MASSKRIPTRLLLLSDTHCAPLIPTSATFSQPQPPFAHPLPSADVAIHSGDLTHTGKLSEYHRALDMLGHISAPVKLVIAGNHDRSLDRDYMVSHWRKERCQDVAEAEQRWREARELWTGVEGRARREGVRFLDEGRHVVDVGNGAVLRVWASPYTPQFCDWGFAYENWQDRFNPEDCVLNGAKGIAKTPIPAAEDEAAVDMVVTHGPALGRLDLTVTGIRAGCPHLLRALMRARPGLAVCGHIHENWGAERVRWSEDSNVVGGNGQSLQEWVDGGWEKGVNGVEEVEVDLEEARQRHAALLDVSESGGRALDRGKETVLVNASVMKVNYRPAQAPWVVVLDLPASGEKT